MTLTLYDNKHTKDTVSLFVMTMNEYKIIPTKFNAWQDGSFTFDLNVTTHKELQGLKKFKKRAMTLINGGNVNWTQSILIPKKYRPEPKYYGDRDGMYTHTTVENIMKYI